VALSVVAGRLLAWTQRSYSPAVPFGIEVADRLRRRGFTDAQVEALRDYTESPALNTAIRSGRVTAGVRNWIDRIHSAMTELPEPIRVTRAQVDVQRRRQLLAG
jgi:hypothetical protein